ncbi:hypothetical protein [Propionispora hippei]|nr:hypothetical protein [Propionispora hippei]
MDPDLKYRVNNQLNASADVAGTDFSTGKQKLEATKENSVET